MRAVMRQTCETTLSRGETIRRHTTMATSDREPPGYTLSNTWAMARERLSAGAVWLDPWTISTLELIGVDAGWGCLEIG